MDLDNGTIKGLILVREQQKKDASFEQQKLNNMTPLQKAQYELDVQKFGLEQAKFNLENGIGTGTTGGTDLRNSAIKYPNEASVKNNNPAGITWNANFDNGTGIAKALQDAGITYSKGTARPASEGGNYVSFDNIGDGMKARQVVFATTYGDKDLSQALQSWKE